MDDGLMLAMPGAFRFAPRDPAPNRGTLMEQRMELERRFEAQTDVEKFSPGQMVTFKDGLASISPDDSAKIALMFWGHIDETDKIDSKLVEHYTLNGSPDVDCWLAFINGTGANLQYFPTRTCDIRGLTQAELDEVG